MILEVGKSYVRDFYNGNLEEAVKEKDGIMWTPERIKGAFNFGKGTEKDLKRYMENNKKYAYFIMIKKEFAMLNATSWKMLKKQLRPLQGKVIFELERNNSMNDGKFLRVLHQVKPHELIFFDGKEKVHLYISKDTEKEMDFF